MKVRTKIIYSSGFFLFTIWLIFLYIKYTDFQNFRHTDIFWVLNIINPFFFIIVLGLALTIGASIWFEEENKWVHIFLIYIFSIVLLCTPYFVCGLARFPDSFSVVTNVQNLPHLLSGGYTSYATNYPMAYLLFYYISEICNINLFFFANFIFSPIVITSFLISWYLFINRYFNRSIAYLSSYLVIPVMLIEVSITPNSIAMVLTVIALLLLSLHSLKGQLLAIILALIMVLVHPIGVIILTIILISFKLADIVHGRSKTKSGFIVSSSLIILNIVAWLAWGVYISPMGSSIIDTIVNIFNFEWIYSQQAAYYSLGGGNNAYTWIQQLTRTGYLMIGLLAVAFIIIDIIILIRLKKIDHLPIKTCIASTFSKKFGMIAMAFLLLVMSFSSLLFIAGGEQIVSRSLNFSMLGFSAFIAASIVFISGHIKKKRKEKLTKYIVAGIISFVILLTVLYPIHGYARESYISYSESFMSGKEFDNRYLYNYSSQIKLLFSENNEYQVEMRGGDEYGEMKTFQNRALLSFNYSKMYTSVYHSLIIKPIQEKKPLI